MSKAQGDPPWVHSSLLKAQEVVPSGTPKSSEDKEKRPLGSNKHTSATLLASYVQCSGFACYLAMICYEFGAQTLRAGIQELLSR